jgi:hypothetical protein
MQIFDFKCSAEWSSHKVRCIGEKDDGYLNIKCFSGCDCVGNMNEYWHHADTNDHKKKKLKKVVLDVKKKDPNYCKPCDLIFIGEISFIKHLKSSKQIKKVTLECDKCPYTSTNSLGMYSHMKIHKTKEIKKKKSKVDLECGLSTHLHLKREWKCIKRNMM